MCVEVYIKSITYTLDTLQQGSQTRLAACGQFRTHISLEGWEGRLLEPESAEIMQTISGLPASVAKSLRIIDVGTLLGKITAWRSGVRGAPVVVIDGCKFKGMKQARKALAELAVRENSQQVSIASE
jgi:hypothetical protein